MFVAVVQNLDGTSYTEKFDEWSAAEGLAKHLTKYPGSKVRTVTVRSTNGRMFGSYHSVEFAEHLRTQIEKFKQNS